MFGTIVQVDGEKMQEDMEGGVGKYDVLDNYFIFKGECNDKKNNIINLYYKSICIGGFTLARWANLA